MKTNFVTSINECSAVVNLKYWSAKTKSLILTCIHITRSHLHFIVHSKQVESSTATALYCFHSA